MVESDSGRNEDEHLIEDERVVDRQKLEKWWRGGISAMPGVIA